VSEQGRQWAIIQGDAREVLAGMDDQSVHCVVTSPPYFGLRSYGTPPLLWGGPDECEHEWDGEYRPAESKARGERPELTGGGATSWSTRDGTTDNAKGQFCRLCGCWRGSLGLEPDPAMYISHLVDIFRAVRRVLRDDGTLWLNIAGCYAGSWGNYHPTGTGGQRPKSTERYERPAYASRDFLPPTANVSSFKPKDWIPIPWMLGMALQADGWWLRSPIIWAKGLSFCEEYSGGMMPESVRDRPTTSYEYVLLLTKAKTYFYDGDAVKEVSVTNDPRRPYTSQGAWQMDARPEAQQRGGERRNGDDFSGRNLRSVWALNPEPQRLQHYASFPTALVEPCIKAGSSERGCCSSCGTGWIRVVEKKGGTLGQSWHDHADDSSKGMTQTQEGIPLATWKGRKERENPYTTATLGWRPGCECYAKEWMHDERAEISTESCTVLDPFSGSGTTVMVALRLGRRAIGIDLNEAYCQMARTRIIEDNPMFNTPMEAR